MLTVLGARRRSRQGCDKSFVAAIRHGVTYGLIQASGTTKGSHVNIATHPLRIPDSKLAREVTEIVRDTESELLFNHSSRVYLFAALAGEHHGLKFDPELLYVGAMFHDMGLTKAHSSEMSASRWTARMRPGIS